VSLTFGNVVTHRWLGWASYGVLADFLRTARPDAANFASAMGERSPRDRSIGQLPHRLGCVAVGCGQAGAAGAEYGAIVGRAVQSGRGGDVNGVKVDQSSGLESADDTQLLLAAVTCLDLSDLAATLFLKMNSANRP